MIKKNIVLFGINADPPHIGHLACVQAVLKLLGPNTKIIVVPSGNHPTNKLQHASFDARYAMCKILFSGLEHVSVDDYEGHYSGPSYTLNTLMHLHSLDKEAAFYFMMSSDVANTFFSWHQPLKILALARPIITSRIGYQLNPTVVEKISSINNPLIVSIDPIEESSTQIREMLAQSLRPNGLTSEVYNYIINNNIYN